MKPIVIFIAISLLACGNVIRAEQPFPSPIVQPEPSKAPEKKVKKVKKSKVKQDLNGK